MNRNDLIYCKYCSKNVPARLLQQHKSGKDHKLIAQGKKT